MNVGDALGVFRLSGIDSDGSTERIFDSAELAGRPAVLAFYPADQSVVCTMQLNHYAEHLPRLWGLDATVWAISPQTTADHAAWLRKRSAPFGFPLLSDPEKEVGRAFGILGLLDLYRRFTVVADPQGTIRWFHRSLAGGLTYPLVSEIAEAIDRIR